MKASLLPSIRILPVCLLISAATLWVERLPADNSPAVQSAPATFATIDEAVARGDEAAVRAFLKAHPESAKLGTRPTLPPLLQAILRKKTGLVPVFIEAGADVNAIDGSNRTALHLAVERDTPDIIPALLKAGAKADVRDRTGWTPLHHAGALDRIECLKALLDGGVKPFTLSDLGGTPLHEAAASGSVALIQLLLEAGVDPKVVSKTGQTALSIAKERGDEAVVKIIVEAVK